MSAPSQAAQVSEADGWAGYPSGWSRIPTPPDVPNGASLGWDGREILMLGRSGGEGKDSASSFSAFDPAAQKWLPLEAPPGPSRSYATATWTGKEMLFIGGTFGGAVNGVAYDPSEKTWRRISPVPFRDANTEVQVWTGRELVLWGGGPRSGHRADTGEIYLSDEDKWRRMAVAPVGLNLADGVWTGREMIVFGSLLDRGNHAATHHAVGAAYDPVANKWSAMPDSQLSPQATSAAWLHGSGNGELIAWDYAASAQAFDPRRDSWSKPVHIPGMSPSECYPSSAVSGDSMLAWYCGEAATFDGTSGKWTAVTGGPTEETITANGNAEYKLWRFADLAPAEDAIFMAAEGVTTEHGTICYGCPPVPHSFWVYRPG